MSSSLLLRLSRAGCILLTSLTLLLCGGDVTSEEGAKHVANTSEEAPLLRWRFAGGTALSVLDDVPSLKRAVNLEEAGPAADRMASVIMREAVKRATGSADTNLIAFWQPLLRRAMSDETAGELAALGWWVAMRDDGRLLDYKDRLGGAVRGVVPLVGGERNQTVGKRRDTWSVVASDEAMLGRGINAIEASTTNVLELDVDLGPMQLSLKEGVNWPRVRLKQFVANNALRTEGEVVFAEPIKVELEPWLFPENEIQQPIAQFSAIRGIRDVWQHLPWFQIDWSHSPPNQMAWWSQPFIPFRTWYSVPIKATQAAPAVRSIHNFVAPWFNESKGTNRSIMGRVVKVPNDEAMAIVDMQRIVQPAIGHVKHEEQSFLYGSFFSPQVSTNHMPDELRQRLDDPNLAYYEYEAIGESVLHWNIIVQFYRIMFGQRPTTRPQDMFLWVMAAVKDAGETVTEVTRKSDTVWTFRRRGPLFLNGMEWVAMVRLADGPAEYTRVRVRLPGMPPQMDVPVPTDTDKVLKPKASAPTKAVPKARVAPAVRPTRAVPRVPSVPSAPKLAEPKAKADVLLEKVVELEGSEPAQKAEPEVEVEPKTPSCDVLCLTTETKAVSC